MLWFCTELTEVGGRVRVRIQSPYLGGQPVGLGLGPQPKGYRLRIEN